jgi:hypothetical protein
MTNQAFSMPEWYSTPRITPRSGPLIDRWSVVSSGIGKESIISLRA